MGGLGRIVSLQRGVHPMENDAILLRQVTENDLEILRLHRNDPGTRVWLEDCREISAAQQSAWYKMGGGRNILIATRSGQEIGLARVNVDQERQTALVGVDIFHAHRGKGLAKLVFHETCEAAIRGGANKLSLWVFLENQRAVRVYGSQGFVMDESEPVKWYVRRFPDEPRAVLHAYMRMIRNP